MLVNEGKHLEMALNSDFFFLLFLRLFHFSTNWKWKAFLCLFVSFDSVCFFLCNSCDKFRLCVRRKETCHYFLFYAFSLYRLPWWWKYHLPVNRILNAESFANGYGKQHLIRDANKRTRSHQNDADFYLHSDAERCGYALQSYRYVCTISVVYTIFPPSKA